MMKIILLFFNIFSSQAADILMKHMPEGRRCIICHQAKSPEHLLLRDGTKISHDKIDVLCGQCHGIKHRRWLDGRHGKVVNSWREGEQKRLSCVVCHDPHAPQFPKFTAKAMPHLRGHEE